MCDFGHCTGGTVGPDERDPLRQDFIIIPSIPSIYLTVGTHFVMLLSNYNHEQTLRNIGIKFKIKFYINTNGTNGSEFFLRKEKTNRLFFKRDRSIRILFLPKHSFNFQRACELRRM
ncbi:hypothetical protein P167DRAFT_48584 [Morchella conica CCBAS932]|uniref:Uncharacterized protein n=1 Tax=Morchella conica CCBAS932 TaxID=1392247 RepID=A0A3N4KWK1_9PEZI|nr:hypothetical protein P167DRAFT_48584 [Morchella conica CCBAS932]